MRGFYPVKVDIVLVCAAFHGRFLFMFVALVVESELSKWRHCVLIKYHREEADGGCYLQTLAACRDSR